MQNERSSLRPAEAVDHLGRPVTCGPRADWRAQMIPKYYAYCFPSS
jgi:hypothetical protein